MTVQQMIEMVMSAYPDAGQTEITLVLKNVVDSFCRRTRVLRQSVSVSGTFATDLASVGDDGIVPPGGDIAVVVNVFEALDTWDANNMSFFEVNSVQYDGELLPKYPALANRMWWVERDVTNAISVQRDRLVIGAYATGPNSSKAALTQAVDIRLVGSCTVLPSFAWSTLTSVIPVYEEFHMGLINGVLKHFAMVKDRDARLAQLHSIEYEATVRQAIARGNRGGVGASGVVKTEFY